MRPYRLYIVFFTAFLCGSPLWAQESRKIDVVQGGHVMQGVTTDTARFERLVGDSAKRVIFSQKTTTISSDSAYLFRDRNRVEAYGNVKIVENDTITVTGQRLVYYGDIKLAKMTGDAVYRDPGLTIESEVMQYDMINKLASYYENGKLVDARNTLTSRIGNYHTESKIASFKYDVVLDNPDYTLYSDTLQYDTERKVAFIRGPSTIVSREDSVVFTFNEGVYETTRDVSVFGRGKIETESYILEGDTLYSDDANRFYSAHENVRMISKEENVIITGKHAKYWKDQELTKVYGNPVMEKIMGDDTLFLSADTLVSIDSKIEEEKRLLAYRDVRIFKTDMQGIADSVAYHLYDSIIYFFADPVLWYDVNQLEADSINIQLKNNTIDVMNLKVNSFLISEDTLLHSFNQIKGREMTIYFRNNEIDRAYVFGNGESVMFAADDDGRSLLGLNKTLCSSMMIRFRNSQFDNASFYTKPEASFIPPHEINPPDRELPGFRLRRNERPDKQAVIDRLGTAFPQPEENAEPLTERLPTH